MIQVSFLFPFCNTSLPNTEGFESTTFPPPGGWSLYNPDGGVSWERTTAASKTGSASMMLDAYDYQTTKAVDILQSPKIDITDVDSIKINFDVAYAQYDAASDRFVADYLFH